MHWLLSALGLSVCKLSHGLTCFFTRFLILALIVLQGYSTAYFGNLLLLAYFVTKGEREAGLIQAIGVVSNATVLTQVTLFPILDLCMDRIRFCYSRELLASTQATRCLLWNCQSTVNNF